MQPPSEGKKDLYRIYFATLFFALHYVLVTYLNSSFLEKVFDGYGKNVVGLAYVAGSLLSIGLLSYAPKIMRNLGNKAFMLMLVLIEIFALLSMGLSHSLPIILAGFIIHDAIIPILYFNFDVFVEHFSKHEETGKARGTFLSIINICFVIMPLIAGIILSYFGFSVVYITAACLIAPLLYLISTIRHFKDADYLDMNLFSGLRKVFQNKDLRYIVLANLLLQVFYAGMVIYMPIYLHDYIGLKVENIGLIFTVMLTPFVIFELPLGKISDTILGEKELLITGFIIMGLSTLILPFIHTPVLVIWAIALFMTRVGAAFVEIMTESYFFKKIDEQDPEYLSVWRSLNGFAYIIMSIAITTLLLYGSLSYMFYIMTGLSVVGIFFASRIKDTL